MLSVFLFIISMVFTIAHLAYKGEWRAPRALEIFLAYVLLFNMGIMSLLAAYAHVFMAAETARMIGWQPGSPFQFEMGMANLSYGVLGVLAFWKRNSFWDACVIGWSILLIGCFVGHLMDFFTYDNRAPFNIGIHIWFYDLFLPILVLSLRFYLRGRQR